MDLWDRLPELTEGAKCTKGAPRRDEDVGSNGSLVHGQGIHRRCLLSSYQWAKPHNYGQVHRDVWPECPGETIRIGLLDI